MFLRHAGTKFELPARCRPHAPAAVARAVAEAARALGEELPEHVAALVPAYPSRGPVVQLAFS